MFLAPAADGGKVALRGFTASHSMRERALEQNYMASLNAEHAREVHKNLTAEPHIAGSAGDRRTAAYVMQQFQSYGLQAEIETFSAVLSDPVEVRFDLLAPSKFSGPTREYVAEDPVSNNPLNPPAFNAYSGSGSETAAVIYVNYGLPGDYQLLKSRGISVAGKIVIARYGASYRGVKARLAEQNRATGLLIYSDPQDDGYHRGDVYPDGAWRPASSVQRGSVLYEFICPGSVEEDGSNVPHLPVIPLSYSDATHILTALRGPAAPSDWQGGLPFTYHIGPGPAVVRMRVRMDRVERPIWNVIAKIPGAGNADEIVLLGNHRDAWAYGGVDPNSGTTTMLELARGLGRLLQQGWRPRRSIWLCSWDGEEMGEFGSVAWAKLHAGQLSRSAVAYLNVDYSVAGPRFVAATVPSLKEFVSEVAADVPDPAGGTVLEQANQQSQTDLPRKVTNVDAIRPVPERAGFRPGNLGGGSDYIAFLDHLGIPSVDAKFDGPYGVYHSIFDDHQWMERFGDPRFTYHVAMARILGLMALRLSEAEILPLDYEEYGQEIESYLAEIENGMTLMGGTGRVDFAPAKRAAVELTHAARGVRKRTGYMLAHEIEPTEDLNRSLAKVEQAFLLPEGLPGRPWYKHAVFAPGMNSGYEPVTLPGIREAAENAALPETKRQIEELTNALHRGTRLLESIH